MLLSSSSASQTSIYRSRITILARLPAHFCSGILRLGLAVIGGSDFIVMLLGVVVVAEGLGDATEPVVQGLEVLFVLGIEQLQRLAIVIAGWPEGAIGLESKACLIHRPELLGQLDAP